MLVLLVLICAILWLTWTENVAQFSYINIYSFKVICYSVVINFLQPTNIPHDQPPHDNDVVSDNTGLNNG